MNGGSLLGRMHPLTWMNGTRRSSLHVAWQLVQEASEQGWSVWWVDGENDLVAENRWLNFALEKEVPLARLVDGDKNGLPGHEFLDLLQQPPEQTLSWWRQLLVCQEGREPTQEELQTWFWRQEKNSTPLELEPKLDARRNEQVNTLHWQAQNTLGHVLPDVLLSQPHMLWLVSHFGSHPRLDAWLGWFLELRQGEEQAPPVLIVMTGDKLEGPRQKSWLGALKLGHVHLLYLPFREPRLSEPLEYAEINRWEAGSFSSREGVWVEEFPSGRRWVVPASISPPIVEAAWPQFADWKTQFSHHHLQARLSNECESMARCSYRL